MYYVHKSQTLNYPRRKLFSLVNDVDGYSQFLPWCEKAEIESFEKKEHGFVYSASIHLKLGFIRQKFTTNNEAKNHSKVVIKLKDGPFKQLNGLWRFEKVGPSQTKISLQLEFEFSNTLIEKTFGKAFQVIAETLLSSFVKRAHQMYG